MNKENKIALLVLWVLIAVSAVLLLLFMTNISDQPNDPVMGGWLDTNLIWAYILLGLGIVIILVADVYHMATNPLAAKKGLMALVFLGVVVVVSYLLASDEMPTFYGVQKYIDSGVITPKIVKSIDAGLYLSYILLGIAVLAMLFAPVTRLFDK